MPHLIALSGGVDSSVALYLAREKYPGEALLGLTLTVAEPGSPLYEGDESNIRDAKAVCAAQNTEHRSLDVSGPFKEKIMEYFVREYLSGRTPNPCVLCNREIKFGLLGAYADSVGCEKIVTGHYARLRQVGSYVYVEKASDPAKDQSYMLAWLTQDQLRRAEFPLGAYTKTEVRAIAEERGFVNARRRDSQDVCFIPHGDYVRFIEEFKGIAPVPGEYVDQAGRLLGTHKGHWCYTLGQRKGLGISLGKYAYVLGKDVAANRVVLGDEDGLFKTKVRITDLHFPGDPDALSKNDACLVKLRYSAREAAAVFCQKGEGEGVLAFSEPQRAPTPGQFAVIYQENCVVACGKIADAR